MITSGPGVTERITMGSLASRSPAERRPRQAVAEPSKKSRKSGQRPGDEMSAADFDPFLPGLFHPKGHVTMWRQVGLHYLLP